MNRMERELEGLGYNVKRLRADYDKHNKHIEELYRSALEEMKYGIITTDPDVTVTKLYADDKEMAEAMTINGETKQILKFGNDPMVDEQYRKDLFGDNDVKLEIETDDDMLEALARFYSNYRSGNETSDEVAARMSSWLLELQELRGMKKNLKHFIDEFSRYINDTRAWAKPINGHSSNKETAGYVQGKLAALNTIDSYINEWQIDYYNRKE